MSEYQYYEFLAIDRPLDDRERADIRSLSTRARITATSFVNEYHWGDFRGSPDLLMERYYDAHLYLASWGTRQVMFRVPAGLLELGVENYCVDDQLSARVAAGSVILTFTSDDESGDFDFDEDLETQLSAVVGVRAELLAGDLRPLYLGWLAGCRAWEGDEDADDDSHDLEPPVPPGLGTLTASQQALAGLLRLDSALLASAASASPALQPPSEDSEVLVARAARLPAGEKDEFLADLIRGDAVSVRTELLRRVRDDVVRGVAVPARRTAGALLEEAHRRRVDLHRQVAARHAEEEARREAARSAARDRRLDDLAREGDASWARVEAMIATTKATQYDAATALLLDLQALAERDGHFDAFTLRTIELRRTHARKPSFIERLDRARL